MAERLMPLENELLLIGLTRMLIPDRVSLNFYVSAIYEYPFYWCIELRERATKIPQVLRKYDDIVFAGYCNPIEILSYSYSLKPVYLKLYRQRFKRSGVKQTFSNIYDFSSGGKLLPETKNFFVNKLGKHNVTVAGLSWLWNVPCETLRTWLKKQP
jgi:hypothetical protein